MKRRRTTQEYRRKTRALSLVLVLLLLLPNLVACTTEAETTGTTQAVTTEATTEATTPEVTTPPATTVSPEELEQNIKDAYRALTATTAADEAITVDLYGEFGDALALKITKDATVLDLEYEIIANREFLYDTEGRLYVYANKTLSPLAAAHTAGIVTDENIRTLYDSFRAGNEALYDEYSETKDVLHPPTEEETRCNYTRLFFTPRKFANDVTYTLDSFPQIELEKVEKRDDPYLFYWILTLPTDTREAAIIAAQALLERCDCRFVDFDGYWTIGTAVQTPNDPFYYNASTLSSMQSCLDYINIPEAWELTTGSDEILIGIIESGIDVTHPDLVGRPNNIPHVPPHPECHPDAEEFRNRLRNDGVEISTGGYTVLVSS